MLELALGHVDAALGAGGLELDGLPAQQCRDLVIGEVPLAERGPERDLLTSGGEHSGGPRSTAGGSGELEAEGLLALPLAFTKPSGGREGLAGSR